MLENHVADHDLISYLDGELDASQAARVEFHFALCEQCRLRAKELEDQLRFLSPRFSSGEVSIARIRSWQRAFGTRVRMHEAAREPLRPGGRRQGAVQILVVAASLLVITSAALLLNERREPRQRQDPTYAQTLEPSARRLAAVASLQRYSYEIVQASPIRRKIAGQLTVWADPQRQRSSLRVDSETGVLRYGSWHPDATSAYTFESSRTQKPFDAQAITAVTTAQLLQSATGPEQLENRFVHWMEARDWQPQRLGRDALLLSGRDGYQAALRQTTEIDGSRKLTIDLRRADTRFLIEIVAASDSYVPKMQRITAYSPAGTYTLVLRTESIRLVDPQQISAAVFSPDASFLRPLKPMVGSSKRPRFRMQPAASVHSHAEQEEVELKILFALHGLGICTLEPVEIRQEPLENGLTLSGRFATAARRDQVLAAITPLLRPWIHVTLFTNDELAGQPRSAQQSSTTLISSAPSPLQTLLHQYLREKSQAGEGLSDAEANRLAGSVLAAARLAERDAWALRRLEARYPAAAIADLGEHARAMLGEMLRSHSQHLCQDLAKLRRLAAPLFESERSGVVPPLRDDLRSRRPVNAGAIAPLFESIERLYDQTALLFAGATTSGQTLNDAPHVPQNLMEPLAAAEGLANAFADEVGRTFPPGSLSVTSAQK